MLTALEVARMKRTLKKMPRIHKRDKVSLLDLFPNLDAWRGYHGSLLKTKKNPPKSAGVIEESRARESRSLAGSIAHDRLS